MRWRPSPVALLTIPLALALIGNLATNTVNVTGTGWRGAVWTALGLLIIASILAETHRDTPGRGVSGNVLNLETEGLARAVRDQWREEEDQRRIVDPVTLPVRWNRLSDDLIDHWANIRCVSGGAEAGPLELDGRLVDRQILEVYRRVPSGRLLILGKKGSGKTVVAVRFALNLLDSWAVGEPVPVVFSMSSWNAATTSLRDWLADQMVQNYVDSRTIARDLIDRGRILPVLDGFDEIAEGLHRPALEALNATSMPMVVTSRRDRYEDAIAQSRTLSRAAGLEMDDLSIDELAAYLPRTTTRRIGPHLAPLWDSVILHLRQQGAGCTVHTALSTPLMVFLARILYSDIPDHDPAELLDRTAFPDSAAIEEHLIGDFIPSAYRYLTGSPAFSRAALSSGQEWQSDHVKRWLGYLANHMPAGNLAWWRLGNAIPRPTRMTVLGLAGGILTGLAGLSVFGVKGALLFGLVGAVEGSVTGYFSGPVPRRVRLQVSGRAGPAIRKISIGLMFGAVAAIVGRVAVMSWGWPALALGGALGGALAGALGGWLRRFERAAKPVGLEIAIGVGGGAAGGLAVGLIGWISDLPLGPPTTWLLLGLAVGAAFGLVDAFDTPIQTETAVSPPSLLVANRKYVVFQSSIVGLAYTLVIGVMLGPTEGLAGGATLSIAYTLAASPWGRWVLLVRIWLPITGNIPWRTMAFLKDAHGRGVLRQTGAVYQFRHERLQAHLRKEAHRASPLDQSG